MTWREGLGKGGDRNRDSVNDGFKVDVGDDGRGTRTEGAMVAKEVISESELDGLCTGAAGFKLTSLACS